MTLLIVDADHISHRAAASCEPTKAKPFLADKHIAISRCQSMIDHLMMKYNDPKVEFHISGEGNWRYDIYPDYKGNRKEMKRPTWLNDVREYLVVQYKATITNDIEVDDICGIRMTQERDRPEKVVCASLDKDLLQIPGYHYSWEIGGVSSTGTQWIKPAAENFITPLDGLRRFYKQVITGDGADHVPAFDGKFRTSTPKFVQVLLDPIDEMTEELDIYNHCVQVYCEERGNPFAEETAIHMLHRNAKVLFIQKDFNQQWNPPGQREDYKLG